MSDSDGRFVAGTPPESSLLRGRTLREKNAPARRLDASAVPQGVERTRCRARLYAPLCHSIPHEP